MKKKVYQSFLQLTSAQQNDVASVFQAFSGDLFDELAEDEISVRGFSFTNKGLEWLMSTRVTVGQVNKVGFVSASSPFACLSAFLYTHSEHGISWKDDKFSK